MTHPDHPALAAQLYAAYARSKQAGILASVVGEEGLTEIDRRFLQFGTHFETAIVGHTETRTMEESMAAGWEGLQRLPISELHRLSDAQIQQHLAAKSGSGE